MKSTFIVSLSVASFIYLMGVLTGGCGWEKLRPKPPAVTASSGESRYTQAQLDSTRTAVLDSITRSGSSTANSTTTTVSGPGKKDTVVVTETKTINYTEFMVAARAQTEAARRQTEVYQQWLDSLAAREIPPAEKRPWLGGGIIARIDGPLKWPWIPEEIAAGPQLRFGKYELKLVPEVGYNWKRKEGIAGLMYRQTF